MKRFFEKLNNEFEKATPAMSDKVRQTPLQTAQGDAVGDGVLAKRGFYSAKTVTFAICMAVILTFSILLFTVILPSVNGGYVLNDSFVKVNINPAFTFVADSDGKVVKVIADNRDGEVVLTGAGKDTFAGKTVEEAVSFVVTEAAKLGFVNGNQVEINGISGRGEDIGNAMLQSIQTKANDALMREGFGGVAVNFAVQNTKWLQNQLTEQGITSDKSDTAGMLDALASSEGYFDRMIKYSSDGNEALLVLSAKKETFERFADEVNGRAQVLALLGKLNDEIRSMSMNALLLSGYYCKDGFDLINYKGELPSDITAKLAKFNAALDFCKQSGLKVESTIECATLGVLYQSIDLKSAMQVLDAVETQVFKWLSNLQEDIKQFVDTVSSAFDSLISNFFGAVSEELQGLLSVIDGISGAPAEDFADCISAMYSQEYQRRLLRNSL
ncbi:MAG: hypothetical protein NC350_01335 [Corallococcus sp.]|nr:hypothetical protein [Corallococcus sp.]